MPLKLFALGTAALAAPLMAQGPQAPPPAVAAYSAANTSAERDQTYALHAQEGDIYEVAASRLALQRSRSRQIRSFAQMMISHHTRSSNELARLVRKGPPVTQANLSEPKSQMLEKLRTSSGAAFEANYVQGQVSAHEEALALHRAYAGTGGETRLRAFAARAVPLVESHLARAKTLRGPSR